MAVKTLREIHVFRKSGPDPETGKDHGDRNIVKREWDAELDKIAAHNHKTPVCCIERRVDTETGDSTTVACLTRPVGSSKEWFTKGVASVGGDAIAENMRQMLLQRSPHAAAAITAAASEASEMRKQMEELKEEIARLKSANTDVKKDKK